MYNNNELRKTSPVKNNTMDAAAALVDAAKARVTQIAPEAQPLLVNTVAADPNTKSMGDLASHTKMYLKDGREGSSISINPNVDAAYYAHELGHGVSQKTGMGGFINKARHMINSNPKMAKALGMSMGTAIGGGLAATGAALQAGDDDLGSSLAIAAALASPTLIDEALASKNALAIMRDAGMRANLGQRGRLAGGFLSYLAPVMISGSVGNTLGNAVDDYTAVYNLGADQQTSGTIQPQ